MPIPRQEISFTTVLPITHPAVQSHLRRKGEAFLQRAYKTIHKYAIIKPQRSLGAIWTSRLVAERNPVCMCEQCWRKYKGWWKQEHYRPDWGWNRLSNCDGCSLEYIFCTLFVAEENFYKVLTESHGLYPQP